MSSNEEVTKINLEEKDIAVSLKLENRNQKYTMSDAFFTLKDQKANFTTRPQFRVINPAKPQLGRIAQIKLENINWEIRYTTGFNQWQSTQNVLDWFKNIKNPKSYAFLKFDIVIYYPLIKSDLFRKAIDYARSVNGIVIPKADVNIMLQCRKSFLFCEGVPWVKLSQENFDVPQGCYDGAEVCEIVGLYLLDKLTQAKTPLFEIQNIGLYRDDGLAK